MSPDWKPAPKRGYVVCPYCFAIVENKGFKRVQHLVSKQCQDSRAGVAVPGTTEDGR